MYAPDQVRIVEDRFEDHLAPVALHFGIALERVGQVGRFGGDAAIEFHQAFKLVAQRPPLFVLGGVDLLDPLAELHDVIPERFQQHVERFAVGLLESARLFAQNVIGEVLELGPESLLHLFAFGTCSAIRCSAASRRACASVLRSTRVRISISAAADFSSDTRRDSSARRRASSAAARSSDKRALSRRRESKSKPSTAQTTPSDNKTTTIPVFMTATK